MELRFDVLTIATLFLTGLALNLTPCVYPMMSVTLSLFRPKDEAPNFLRSLIKASAYVLGIISMYTSLGVFAALSGNLFGAFLQNRAVLILIGLIFVIFSLGMLGAYTFRLPETVMAWASRKKGTGLIGLYLSGLVVGVFAAPCIGPPIVALLTVAAATQNALMAFWTFLFVALGLGFPYLVLGTFSSLTRFLPKSGIWLVWVERLFGVILMGFGFFYLILAAAPQFLWAVLPVTLIAGAIHLGFIDRTLASPKLNKIRRAGAITMVIIGAALLSSPRGSGVLWEPYTPEKLSEAKELGKPVIMDYFADWCLPCHELDHVTYRDKRVIEALDPFVRIKVDLTNPESKNLEEVIEKFNIIGVPTILFLDASGQEVREARMTGYVSPDEFVETLDKYRNQFGPRL